jgi:hypothetical protein
MGVIMTTECGGSRMWFYICPGFITSWFIELTGRRTPNRTGAGRRAAVGGMLVLPAK